MITHTLNPTILTILGREIRWYGLFYLIGLVGGYFLIKYLAEKRHLKMSKKDIEDLVVWVGFGLILGGRLGYFLFYNTSQLFSTELFKIWNGGMSFHGAFIGTLVAGVWYCKRKGFPVLKVADVCILPAALALALGRVGNFINGELVGRLWNGAWCIDYSQNQYIYPVEGCRYPSQLVAVGKNLLTFGILWYIKDLKRIFGKKYQDGTLVAGFIFFYGIFRFLVEFYREPDVQLGFVVGWMTMGQVLSSVMVLVGIAGFWWLYREK